jgi:hypothetical protein
LRVKNATKNGVINRLRHLNTASEIEKKTLQEEIRQLQAENVVNKCIMGAKIKDLEGKLERASKEIGELKNVSPRIKKGYALMVRLLSHYLFFLSSTIFLVAISCFFCR